MHTTLPPDAPPPGEPRPFTWSVQSSEISFMRHDAEGERNCSDCVNTYDCGCIVPHDPPPRRKAARSTGGSRARSRP